MMVLLALLKLVVVIVFMVLWLEVWFLLSSYLCYRSIVDVGKKSGVCILIGIGIVLAGIFMIVTHGVFGAFGWL